MHSSRMRTARYLPYGVLPDRDPPWTETPHGQRPPWTETLPVDKQTPVKTLTSPTLFAGGKNPEITW